MGMAGYPAREPIHYFLKSGRVANELSNERILRDIKIFNYFPWI